MYQQQQPGPYRPPYPPAVRRKRLTWLPWAVGGGVLALLVVAGVIGSIVDPKAFQDPTVAETPAVPSETAHLTADGLAQQLGVHGLIWLLRCTGDAPALPTLTQERCPAVGGGGEVVVMAFADSVGTANGLARLKGIMTAGGLHGAVVQGPYWLVNVSDVNQQVRSDIQKALGGTLVSFG